LGGGMRQAGVLAAAGLVALRAMVNRLEGDHLRAQKIAEGLKDIPGIHFHKDLPQTNMVFMQLNQDAQIKPADLCEYFAGKGILFSESGPDQFRLVTHYWIDDADVERIISSFKEALS